jgi:hypothetical protein
LIELAETFEDHHFAEYVRRSGICPLTHELGWDVCTNIEFHLLTVTTEDSSIIGKVVDAREDQMKWNEALYKVTLLLSVVPVDLQLSVE